MGGPSLAAFSSPLRAQLKMLWLTTRSQITPKLQLCPTRSLYFLHKSFKLSKYLVHVLVHL